jgi:hypothetical protein
VRRAKGSADEICVVWHTVKALYFDINGSIVCEYQCKPALADGPFEQAVREAGFQRLVCMSNARSFVKLLNEMGHATNPLTIMCWGAFCDADWFRQITTLVPDPDHRALRSHGTDRVENQSGGPCRRRCSGGSEFARQYAFRNRRT